MVLMSIVTLALHAAGSDPLVRRLVTIDNRERETAQQELADLPKDQQKKVVAALIPLLEGTETEQREHAAEALTRVGPGAEAAIPALQRNLSDDFPYVRVHSAEALAQIGPAALPAFIQALQNDTSEVRTIAVEALSHLGPAAKPAIPS